MPAKIIAIAHQKGGACKTTTAMHLAGALSMEGLRVQVADADRQNSATKWSSNAPDDSPFPAVVVNLAAAGAKIHREIEKGYDLYDVILVDCPPNVESVVPVSVLLVSDLVIVPMQPTTTELESLTDFLPLVERSQVNNPGLQCRVLVTRYRKNTMSAHTMGKLDEIDVARFATLIGDRTCYAEGDLWGSHVLAQKGVPASAKVEMRALVEEVLEVLGMGGV